MTATASVAVMSPDNAGIVSPDISDSRLTRMVRRRWLLVTFLLPLAPASLLFTDLFVSSLVSLMVLSKVLQKVAPDTELDKPGYNLADSCLDRVLEDVRNTCTSVAGLVSSDIPNLV